MKLCFPIEKFDGIDSVVFSHFGSAPGFVLIDSIARQVEEIANTDQHHEHGMCHPLKALGNRPVDAVAVTGIGMGALMKLVTQGIRVFHAQPGTVRDNLALLIEGRLPEFSPEMTCGGQGPGGGCAHH